MGVFRRLLGGPEEVEPLKDEEKAIRVDGNAGTRQLAVAVNALSGSSDSVEERLRAIEKRLGL